MVLDFKWVIRTGDWKFHMQVNPTHYRLYNLKDDPTEQVNVADIQPEKVAEMKK